MRIKTLYQDDKLTLQKLIITVGSCRMIKYREITNDNKTLDVKDIKEPPLWYLRWRKLKQIGI